MISLLMAMALQAAVAPPPAWPADLPACPSSGEPIRVYPELAVRAVRDGRVKLLCTVGEDRRFSGCVVAAEFPKGMNFAKAALAYAHCLPPGDRGQGETVTLPIHFQIPGRGTPPPKDGVTITARGYWR